MKRLDAERVYMRPYEKGDTAMYLAAGLRNRTHLAAHEAGNPLNDLDTLDDANQLIGDFVAAWESEAALVMGVFDRNTDEWLGQVYVTPTNPDLPEYAIGFVVDVGHQGRGLMTEAVRAALEYLFEERGAHRIRSDCSETNERSWRLLERCGFTREGHFRENRRNADGSYRGDYQYGILRREFPGT